MRITVLGAGIIGITTAYRLARDGHRVTVIDRQPGPALEASFANAAQIAAALSGPWAAPGVPGQILHWMRRTDSPMRFRLKADPAQWLWSLRFLAECRRDRFETTFRRMLDFGRYSQRMLAGVKQETGLAYDQLEKGILKLCTTPETVAELADFEAILRRSDIPAQRIPIDEAIALEPALEASHDRLAACLHLPTDETGDAHLFARGLAERCEALGVDFRYGHDIRDVELHKGEILSVRTHKGEIDGELFVLALGSHSPRLARKLGLSLPVYPVKGYSATVPVGTSNSAPQVSLYIAEKKVAMSRLGGRLRIAGMADIAGYDLNLEQARARQVLESGLSLFPDIDGKEAEFWCGLRPLTPDGLPVLGSCRVPNLLLNTGHGTYGWTYACGSAQVIADLAAGRTPDHDLSGMTISRFSL
ncbi:D-amino acid dehydrogenase [Oceanibaculum indicum]|uniref:D-amino acid dehydrogenase small subunit n=1 Tax=Oceanibaculum indicum P24 TaxID=1207063 RepID=K2K4B6_9PROT|nr:D-amino acid dehydrogenase [Oceanibaculum indicum]EKE77779.1 D-amino acid dehydrogenase small subunit [Oceanibaculum indicum P24]